MPFNAAVSPTGTKGRADSDFDDFPALSMRSDQRQCMIALRAVDTAAIRAHRVCLRCQIPKRGWH